MEKKDSLVKRGRRKKEDTEKNSLEDCPPDDDVSHNSPISSTPVTAKRRGRKPKGGNQSLQTPEPKSYPKRNRKTPIRVDYPNEDGEENSSTLSHAVSDISQDVTNDSEQVTPKPKTGRKRGRLSKKSLESVEETPIPKKKRGTSAEEDKKDTLDDYFSGKKETKGRKGRQKTRTDFDLSVDDSKEEDGTSGDKTDKQEGKQQKVSSQDTPSSKGRRSIGRKARQKGKNTQQDVSSEDGCSEDSEREVTPAKKSSGKGKRSKDTEQVAGSEVTCLRCQEKFPDFSKLKNHLMRKHCAMYSPDCPEGNDDRSSVRQILKIKKVLYCPKCDKELRNIQYYFKHFEWCGRERETFTCTVCDRNFMKMYEFEHYRNHKLLERKEKERQEELARLKEIKKKKEAEDESETDQSGRRMRKAAKKAVNVLKDISATGDAFAEDDNDADPEVRLDDEEDAEDQAADEDDVEEDASDEINATNSESEADEDSGMGERKGTYNLFVGGPVWGLAWCPIPHNVKSDQFLAISCHRQMDEFHETMTTYSGNGSIQLWNIGKKNSIYPNESAKTTLPFVEYCVSHIYGVVYQLCWCPSNAWENNSSEEEESELLPRLGLLAGAFSDGKVHIYSLPQPNSLNKEKQEGTPATFKPEPVYSLVPCPTTKPDRVVPCLCVDWQPRSCQFIAAGYGDGTYRIWDLKSQSSLLRIASTPSIELLPFHSGVAHSDAVMSLKWSPHVTDKFATASRDRSFAIWDLKNRHCPFYKSPGQMSLSLCWLPFNFCVLQGMEDCYSNLEAYVRAESYDHVVDDEVALSDPVVTQSDCIWGLTCSNWLMVILATNNSGIIGGSIMPQLKRTEVKRFNRRPVYLFETAVHEKNFCKEKLNSDKKEGTDSTVLKSYESGKNLIYLEYKEYDPSKVRRKVPKFTVPADNIRSFAFRALYRIEMSPNIQSCVWVVSGGQAGIVRIHSVAPQLLSSTLQDLKDVRQLLNLK
ncbi:uncharacterized protein LOC125645688 isoform X2 [Ostrea edulis]|uniref:uncharacterized protein LOC125645688 isoform X2 n=1 Tax=Ostrea edulis TaxID=37623 RepID=UPI0024AF30AE|nr:uncharacterized protein LOC125645688 isoform X2 [Ostrea edulis]